jgi:hypothetical protein
MRRDRLWASFSGIPSLDCPRNRSGALRIRPRPSQSMDIPIAKARPAAKMDEYGEKIAVKLGTLLD